MYPKILDERDTLREVLMGRSLSRVGEGELRLAVGVPIKSQRCDPRLTLEIRSLLRRPSDALVCLPRIWPRMPAENFWRQFESGKYSRFYGLDLYGSAFVSRADMVHAIDSPDYWRTVTDIWRGCDVVLASRNLKVLDLSAASSVRFVSCPPVDAYDEIDRIEDEIGRPDGPVLLAIGATATVLAVRLAAKGVHAIDVGHMGRFMVSAGAYSVDREALISDAYVEQNRILHKRPEGYGGSGHKRRDEVLAFATELGAAIILDYGCGQGTLKTSLAAVGRGDVLEYDPAIKGKNGFPKPAELVVCTDVLEHVEPEKLTAVLEHLHRLTLKAAFFVIAMRKANKILPDNRNAHLIIEGSDFWVSRIEQAGFTIVRQEAVVGKEIKLWLVR